MVKLLLCLSFIQFSYAKIQIITTTPDLAWIAQEIVGDKGEVASLLSGSEDPHYVDAMPHWIAKVRNADVFCVVGLELEVGWAPKVIARSGNPRIQVGEKGYCDASKFVTKLDIPKGKIDRSMGDVHAGGNPHYQLSPKAMAEASKSILDSVIESDQESAKIYLENFNKLKKRLGSIGNKVRSILGNKTNLKLMSYHKEFSYFLEEFGFKNYFGEIESKPGVPPSAGRIAQIGIESKKNRIDLVLATSTGPTKLLSRFSEISGVPFIQVPIMIQSENSPNDYESLITGLAKAIVKKVNESP